MMSGRDDDRYDEDNRDFDRYDDREQLPVFNTSEFQGSTNIMMNRAFRYDLLRLLSDFRNLKPPMAAFRNSLRNPAQAAKPRI